MMRASCMGPIRLKGAAEFTVCLPATGEGNEIIVSPPVCRECRGTRWVDDRPPEVLDIGPLVAAGVGPVAMAQHERTEAGDEVVRWKTL